MFRKSTDGATARSLYRTSAVWNRFKNSDREASRSYERQSNAGANVMVAGQTVEISMETASECVARMRELISRVESEGASTAFQSVAVAAAQAITRALDYEERAAHAAISLAQQDKLKKMITELRDHGSELKHALNEQGRRLLNITGEIKIPDDVSDEKETWWFALSEAMHRLEEDARWIGSIVSGQASGAPARELGELVQHLLQRHHSLLLVEAERWMA